MQPHCSLSSSLEGGTVTTSTAASNCLQVIYKEHATATDPQEINAYLQEFQEIEGKHVLSAMFKRSTLE